MTVIIKNLPVRFARGDIERFFGLDGKPCWTTYYFTLGGGRPAKANLDAYSNPCQLAGFVGIDDLWFAHKGKLIGHFKIEIIVQNVGQLPKLTNMDGDPSAWQIKDDHWVAVCQPPFDRLDRQIYHEGFRGWRYFDFEKYSKTLGSKLRI